MQSKSCTEMDYKHDNIHEFGYKQLISAPKTTITLKITQKIRHKSSLCKGVDAK